MVSIVIPAYNEESSLPACLEGLCAQRTKIPFEVIVVDNASTDNTTGIAKQYQNRLSLRVIEEKQKGRGAARATGFAAAKGDIIFSTDADAIVPPDWVDSILYCFRDKSVSAVTGAAYVDDCTWTTNVLFRLLFPVGMVAWRVIIGEWLICGFNFAIRKELYQKIGGFNSSLNGGEDVDVGIQIQKVGGKIIWKAPIIWFSGRRFSKGFLKGSFPYLKIFNDYFILRRKEIYLSDVRGI